MSLIPDEYRDLFKKPAFGHLATVMADGSPQITPVWVDFDGEHVLVNSKLGRVKNANMAQRSAVAIEISDPDNPYRYLSIRGHVVAVVEENAAAHLEQLSQRYLQKPYPWWSEGEVRQIFKILPERVVARVI
ncbi:MAG: PPOX class F420-dependent oxidoreductase [Anaerolineae bacterium]